MKNIKSERAATTVPPLELDGVVSALGKIRRSSHRFRYADSELPELPSKRSVLEVVDLIAAALFPRHYGPIGLSSLDLDSFVAKTLTEAFSRLETEVAAELALSASLGRTIIGGDTAPRQLVQAYANQLPELRKCLETDIRAAFEGDPAATSLDEVMSCYPGVFAILRHRLAHGLYLCELPMIARIIAEASHAATGIDIHPGAQIGESFFIDHGTGVVIGETAVIGARVRLYQGVTLGARRFLTDESGVLAKRYPRHPILEDEVVVYAGATILGRVTIGKGSTIGGGVWLTSSVPAGSQVSQAQLENRSQAFL